MACHVGRKQWNYSSLLKGSGQPVNKVIRPLGDRFSDSWRHYDTKGGGGGGGGGLRA